MDIRGSCAASSIISKQAASLMSIIFGSWPTVDLHSLPIDQAV